MQEHINGIPTRILGKTGARVTIIGLGGHAVAKKGDSELGIRIVRTAIDDGINFMDNAWCYHGGESERIMGMALKDGYREKVFLMTKNHGRRAAIFRTQLEESLRRLQTDHIDLIQFHEIIYHGEPEEIYSEGAIEEAIKAREEGKVRFIGFSGHRWPHLFQKMLDGGFEWDTVQMPTNPFDYLYRSFAEEILPILVERDIGVIGMKSLGGSGAPFLDAGITLNEAMSFALSMPVHTLVSGIDSMEFLKQNLQIAREFEPLTEGKQRQLLQRIAPLAQDGHLEKYKTQW